MLPDGSREGASSRSTPSSRRRCAGELQSAWTTRPAPFACLRARGTSWALPERAAATKFCFSVATSNTTVEELLAEARSRIARLSPTEAHEAARGGALLIDIRAESQRARDGHLPTARFIPRNVLEWRLDPSCPHRDDECARTDRPLILICDEGYQSSLAAATLSRFGLNATDVVGGFRAWRDAGLPVEKPH